MDAVEFLKQFNRMCKAYNDDGCKECPAYRHRCGEEFDGQEEDGVSIVEQWAKEHPIKTRQSEFLKMFPNARMESDGISSICPIVVDKRCHNKDDDDLFCLVRDKEECGKCRRDFWLAEIKDGEA